MDFSTLLSSAKTQLSNLTSKAKDAANNVAETLEETMSINSLEQWDALKAEKRVILVCIEKHDPHHSELMLKMPLTQAAAWQMSTQLRIVRPSESTGLCEHLNARIFPCVLGFRETKELDRKEDWESIKTYLETCNVSKAAL